MTQLSLFAPKAAGLSFHACSTWDPHFVQAIRAHYTGSRGAPPGRKLAWVVVEDGEAIGVLGLGEPPYKLAARRRLGIQDARPLPGTACNFIFRRWGGVSPGSAILRAWHPVAGLLWQAEYGEALEHWESLVLPSAVASEVPGACFRKAGYRSLGMTTGRSARRPAGSTHTARVWSDAEPKLVLYRGPLARVNSPVI